MPKRDFNKDAASWDESPTRVRLAQDVADAIRREVVLEPSMDVLDFGCGTGLLSFAVLPHVRSVTGADSSTGMLDVFRKKAAGLKSVSVKTVLLESESDDLLPGSYDLIMSSMVLHHIQNVPAALENLYKVIRPGGKMALADLQEEDGCFHEDPTGVFHHGFSQEKIGGMLKEAGFTHVAIVRATVINKVLPDGKSREFPVFLATAQKR